MSSEVLVAKNTEAIVKEMISNAMAPMRPLVEITEGHAVHLVNEVPVGLTIVKKQTIDFYNELVGLVEEMIQKKAVLCSKYSDCYEWFDDADISGLLRVTGPALPGCGDILITKNHQGTLEIFEVN